MSSKFVIESETYIVDPLNPVNGDWINNGLKVSGDDFDELVKNTKNHYPADDEVKSKLTEILEENKKHIIKTCHELKDDYVIYSEDDHNIFVRVEEE